MNLWGKTATALAAAIMFSGCGIPLTSEDLPPARPTETIGEPTPDASASAPATVGPIQNRVACVALSKTLLRDANNVGNVGGDARYVSGRMVKAGHGWWFVAVKAEINNPESKNVNGINDEGLMAFVTNAPSGGSRWVPLSDMAESDEERKWDGVTPTGDRIPGWRDYREAALNCLRQA